jgi:hypothetical protein
VTDRIAIGNSASAITVGALFNCGIEAVLNVANDCFYRRPTVRILYGASRLIDGPGNHVYDLARASMILDQLLCKRGGRVLVHCHAGVSRSPIVVATYLVMLDRTWEPRTIDKTLTELAQHRGFIDPRSAMITLAEACVLTGEGKIDDARQAIQDMESELPGAPVR